MWVEQHASGRVLPEWEFIREGALCSARISGLVRWRSTSVDLSEAEAFGLLAWLPTGGGDGEPPWDERWVPGWLAAVQPGLTGLPADLRLAKLSHLMAHPEERARELALLSLQREGR